MTTLKRLYCNQSLISDLSPLKGIRLEHFHYAETSVQDISVLRGMPLEHVWVIYKPERDEEILHSLKLKTINAKPAADFWKEVDAKKGGK
jgi:hypothetical protein